MEKHICPVRGKYCFEEVDNLDKCPVCGWMNDMLAEVSPDTISYAGFSLNECKVMLLKTLNGGTNNRVRLV